MRRKKNSKEERKIDTPIAVKQEEKNRNDPLLNEFLIWRADRNLARLLLFMLKKNKIMFLNFLMINIKAMTVVIMPRAQARLTDSVVGGNIVVIKKMFALSIMAHLFYFTIKFFSEWLDNKVAYSMDKTLSTVLYSYIENQDAAYKARISPVKFGINLNNLLRLSKVWQKINKIFGLSVELIFVLITLYFSGNILTNLIISSFFLFYFIFFFLTNDPHRRETLNKARGWNNLTQTIINNFNFLNTINIFNRQDSMAKNFIKTRDNAIEANKIMFRIRLAITSTVDLSFIFLQYSIFACIIVAICQGKLSLGFLTLFGILIHRSYHAMKELLSEFKIFEDITVAMESMRNIFYRDIKGSTEYINNISNSLTSPLQNKKLDIDIKDLTVKVANLNERRNQIEETIIHIENLNIKEGQKYIVVGLSGCGKSSLANVLVGLWSYEGQFLLGGQDVKTMSLHDLREKITLVAQETTLLPISIAENIAYGNNSASQEDIENAAKMACIHDVIMSLPQQYQTIAQDSCFLSFGEIQRVALARLFLSRAKVIVLDESTSSLDIPTELNIYANIDQCCKDRTLIVIAHRMAVLKYISKVIFMHEGQVVATGTHRQLLKTNQQYREFIKSTGYSR
jgi:ATP-binding cassette subfamily B protein